MRKHLEQICTSIFCILLTICLILALFAGAGFIIAFLVGGAAAVSLCAFLNNYMLPTIYIAGSFIAILGVLKMYLAGEKSFFLDLKGRK